MRTWLSIHTGTPHHMHTVHTYIHTSQLPIEIHLSVKLSSGSWTCSSNTMQANRPKAWACSSLGGGGIRGKSGVGLRQDWRGCSAKAIANRQLFLVRGTSAEEPWVIICGSLSSFSSFAEQTLLFLLQTLKFRGIRNCSLALPSLQLINQAGRQAASYYWSVAFSYKVCVLVASNVTEMVEQRTGRVAFCCCPHLPFLLGVSQRVLYGG